MRTRLVSIAALFVVVLAACGGDDDKSSSTTTTSAPATTSSTAARAQQVRDAVAHARAQKLVLVQADMPAGWTGTAATPRTPEENTDRQQFATCLGTTGEADTAATVDGDRFAMGPTTQVFSEANIVKEPVAYQRDLAALKSSKLLPCLQDLLSKGLARTVGSPPSSAEMSSIPVPTFGDATVGARMKAAITAQGLPLTAYLDVVVMAKDRAEVTATFVNVGQPFDNALETSLINKLGAKLNAA